MDDIMMTTEIQGSQISDSSNSPIESDIESNRSYTSDGEELSYVNGEDDSIDSNFVKNFDNDDNEDMLNNESRILTPPISETLGIASETDGKPKNKKRKLKEKKNGSSKKKRTKEEKKQKFERKNIRKIIGDRKLEKDTLDALLAEEERKSRLKEMEERRKEQQMANKKAIDEHVKTIKSIEECVELQSLLAGDEDISNDNDTIIDSKTDDVICLSSDDDEEISRLKENRLKREQQIKMFRSKKAELSTTTLLSESKQLTQELLNNDLNNAMSDMSGSSDIEEDDQNSGILNDSLNLPDEYGRVLVNVGHSNDEKDIFLPSQITRVIKPHQISGIRFLYDNLIESTKQFSKSAGFGCILAHSMGLGKTIQMISLIDIFLRFTSGKTVLCIVPINTLQNWLHEFNMWLPPNNESKVNYKKNAKNKDTKEHEIKKASSDESDSVSNDVDSDIFDKLLNEKSEEVQHRNFKVFILNDSHKTMESRQNIIDCWYKEGGVLLMGYEMYRLLSSKRGHIPKPKRKTKGVLKPEIIDLEEEDKNKDLLMNIQEALISPGPDLVICDEGHRIKNSHANISQALKSIETRRRVVLTGYPLQNNLIEYWCMVDFVRPNYLGTRQEFSNMFERPITNGQCLDSTPEDFKLMKYRAHVLHSLLEGFVQRRGHSVLKYTLPAKEEYVLIVKMSSIQRQLYQTFLQYLSSYSNSSDNGNAIKAFSVCCKIWNHPDILYKCALKNENSIADLDLDFDNNTLKNKSKSSKTKISSPKLNSLLNGNENNYGNFDFQNSLNKREKEDFIDYEWAKPIFENYSSSDLNNGGKMLILFNILQKSIDMKEKVLVFSQSLFTLDLIETYLIAGKVEINNTSCSMQKNKNYFRLDGSTGSLEREKLVNAFNSPDNDSVNIFLLSTRAGCLGINLIGANRVVIMDASWNPCHDCQAVCRIYRYGQKKSCFIYRLVTDNSMEKKIYDRQINKQGMSNRVVDELNPDSQFKRGQVENLLHYVDSDPPSIDPICSETISDEVLSNVIKNCCQFMTKIPFTHESLLLDRQDSKLTKMEKRLAKKQYLYEKGKINFQNYNRANYSSNLSNNMPTISSNSNFNTSFGQYAKSDFKTNMQSAGFPNSLATSTPVLKPEYAVQPMRLTFDIPIPGNDLNGIKNVIKAGELFTIIKSPKGTFIRTSNGKVFAVKNKSNNIGNSLPQFSMQNVGKPRQNILLNSNYNSDDISIIGEKSPNIKTSFVNSGSSTLTQLLDSSFPAALKYNRNSVENPSLSSIIEKQTNNFKMQTTQNINCNNSIKKVSYPSFNENDNLYSSNYKNSQNNGIIDMGTIKSASPNLSNEKKKQSLSSSNLLDGMNLFPYNDSRLQATNNWQNSSPSQSSMSLNHNFSTQLQNTNTTMPIQQTFNGNSYSPINQDQPTAYSDNISNSTIPFNNVTDFDNFSNSLIDDPSSSLLSFTPSTQSSFENIFTQQRTTTDKFSPYGIVPHQR